MTPEDLDPPRFTPRGQAERPTAAGARRIGAPTAPAHTRAMPTGTRHSTVGTERPRLPAAPPRPQAAAPAGPPARTAPAPARPQARTTPAPAATALETTSRPPRARGSRRGRLVTIGALSLALLLAWPVGLLVWANGKVVHTPALSGAAGTPGTTYLLVGSDSRADGAVTDGAAGQRSDTILVLHVAENGNAAMISLPRDTYVQIEGYGGNKLNAAFAFGAGPLLVRTVEGLTGLTVDHYVEIGMGGVVALVDAVGGVNLCLDYDVNDELSQLVWTAGCHDVDGATALAFARMRYSDPLGDMGRQARQRQVIAAIVRKAAKPATLLNPFEQTSLVEAGTGVLATDEDTGIVNLARLALAFRSATGEGGVTGSPPIADLDYHPGGIGSTVLLDTEGARVFFDRLRTGELTQEDVK